MVDFPPKIDESSSGHYVTATKYLRGVRGGSQSCLLLADDNHAYIVKFLQNAQHPKVLFNEWLASGIARDLGLSVPLSGVIFVSEEFIAECPELQGGPGALSGRRQTVMPGLHYGSRLVGGLLPGLILETLPEAMSANVDNIDQFIGALVLDKWVCNTDARQAVFLRSASRKRFKAILIDHGHCFNYQSWTFKDAPLQGRYPHDWVYREVSGWHDFRPWLEKVGQIKLETLRHHVGAMPSEWLEGQEKNAQDMLQRLAIRVDQLPMLLADFRDARPHIFPSWTKP